MDPNALLTQFGDPSQTAALFEQVATILHVIGLALRQAATDAQGSQTSSGFGDKVHGALIGPDGQVKQTFHSGAAP